MDNFNSISNKFGALKKIKKILSGPRIIFVILGAVILIELIYAARVLSSPTARRPVNSAETVVSQGKITLFSEQTEAAVNGLIPVSVTIDSGGHELAGVDLIVNYDPKILEAPVAELAKGDIFDEYPLLSVDPQKGTVSISAISGSETGFKGIGKLATINFRAKEKGASILAVEFQAGSSSDSNLVEEGTSKDILEAVENIDITVQ